MTDASTRITSSPPTTSASTTTNSDAWKYRRRFLLWNTVFNMSVIVLALLYGKHESVSQLAVLGGFASLTTIFGFYVAGVVWDDHSIRSTNLAGLQIAAAQSPPPAKDGGREQGP